MLLLILPVIVDQVGKEEVGKESRKAPLTVSLIAAFLVPVHVDLPAMMTMMKENMMMRQLDLSMAAPRREGSFSKRLFSPFFKRK